MNYSGRLFLLFSQSVILKMRTLWSAAQVATVYLFESGSENLSLNLILRTESEWPKGALTTTTLFQVASASSMFQTMSWPVSNPINMLYSVASSLLLGKKLIAVVLAAALTGSSLYTVPILSSSSEEGPCQTLTAFYFSREPVAKILSSCDHEIPQIILEWASLTFFS